MSQSVSNVMSRHRVRTKSWHSWFRSFGGEVEKSLLLFSAPEFLPCSFISIRSTGCIAYYYQHENSPPLTHIIASYGPGLRKFAFFERIVESKTRDFCPKDNKISTWTSSLHICLVSTFRIIISNFVHATFYDQSLCSMLPVIQIHAMH